MKRFLCLFLLSGFSLSNVHGQTSDSDSARVYYSRPVVVTGTQEMMSDRFVPATISVVGSKDLKSSGQISLLDALSEQVPGLFVAERGLLGYGINGQAGTITIRGLGGSPNTQVLVMIDGVPQFMGIFGHPLPDSYLSEDAERVEVIRGPASVLYGTNAMGGVINIITKKNRHKGSSLRASATYGSYETQQYSAGFGYSGDRFDVLISGDRDQTDGHRPNSSFSTGGGYINAGYSFNSNITARLNGIVNKFKTYDPGTVYSPLVNNWVDVLRSTTAISLTDKFSGFDGSLKLFLSYGDHTVYDGFHSLDRNIGALLYQNYHAFEGNVITIGGDFKHYGGMAVNNITGFSYGTHYLDEFGIYVLLEQLFFNRLMLNAGARLEEGDIYGAEFVPQVGIAWTCTDQMTLKASISKGFRSPTIRELYLFPAPNPGLKPEMLWNYEISLLESITRHVEFELAGFLAEGTNLILTEGVYPNLKLLNSGAFSHKGIEIVGHYRAMDNLRMDATYSYVNPGMQTYSTPKHKVSLGVDYSLGKADINLTLEHIAGLYGADNSQKKLPNYTVMGAHISYEAARFLQLSVSGDNLLNVGYQTIYGYPMPGRTLFAGVTIRIESEE